MSIKIEEDTFYLHMQSEKYSIKEKHAIISNDYEYVINKCHKMILQFSYFIDRSNPTDYEPINILWSLVKNGELIISAEYGYFISDLDNNLINFLKIAD